MANALSQPAGTRVPPSSPRFARDVAFGLASWLQLNTAVVMCLSGCGGQAETPPARELLPDKPVEHVVVSSEVPIVFSSLVTASGSGHGVLYDTEDGIRIAIPDAEGHFNHQSVSDGSGLRVRGFWRDDSGYEAIWAQLDWGPPSDIVSLGADNSPAEELIWAHLSLDGTVTAQRAIAPWIRGSSSGLLLRGNTSLAFTDNFDLLICNAATCYVRTAEAEGFRGPQPEPIFGLAWNVDAWLAAVMYYDATTGQPTLTLTRLSDGDGSLVSSASFVVEDARLDPSSLVALPEAHRFAVASERTLLTFDVDGKNIQALPLSAFPANVTSDKMVDRATRTQILTLPDRYVVLASLCEYSYLRGRWRDCGVGAISSIGLDGRPLTDAKGIEGNQLSIALLGTDRIALAGTQDPNQLYQLDVATTNRLPEKYLYVGHHDNVVDLDCSGEHCRMALIRETMGQTESSNNGEIHFVIATTDEGVTTETVSEKIEHSRSELLRTDAKLTATGSAVILVDSQAYWLRANASVAWRWNGGPNQWVIDGVLGTRERPLLLISGSSTNALLEMSESRSSQIPMSSKVACGIDCGDSLYAVVPTNSAGTLTISRIQPDGTLTQSAVTSSDDASDPLCANNRLYWLDWVEDVAPAPDADHPGRPHRVLRSMSTRGESPLTVDLPEGFEWQEGLKIQAASDTAYFFGPESDTTAGPTLGASEPGYYPIYRVSSTGMRAVSDFALPAPRARAERFAVHDADMHIASRTETALYLSRYRR